MAVELRCPGCRAKLRLPTAPEEGSEIECPKCATVFAAEGNAASPRVDEDQPRKKSTDDDDDRPRKKKKDKPAKSGGEKGKRKLKKLKKRKSNPYVLWGAVLSGLLLLGIFIGAILWFFNRKSASQEMMMYLPDDCDEVSGINLGHLQKYPEFYKSCESAFGNTGFKHAADIFCDALGEKTNDVVDYVVQGVGRAGGTGQEVAATVFHTKVDYDTTLLSKLSGANKGTRNGVDYYLISDIPGLNYGGIKVFAPTKRLVVFCRADTPDAKFDAMLNGNKDNPDATPFKRGGQLSKAIIRGTAWKFMIYGRSVTKFAGPEAPTGGGGGLGGGQENDEDAIRREVAEVLQNSGVRLQGQRWLTRGPRGVGRLVQGFGRRQQHAQEVERKGMDQG